MRLAPVDSAIDSCGVRPLREAESVVSRLVTWTLTVTGWSVLGCVIGVALDRVLWSVSFDYLYSPQEFARKFGGWSLAIGTVVGAASTTGRQEPQSRFSIVLSMGLALFLAIAGAIVWALTAHRGFLQFDASALGVGLAPSGRVRFCRGLWQGAIAGYGLGAMFALIRIRRGPRIGTEPSHSPIRSRRNEPVCPSITVGAE